MTMLGWACDLVKMGTEMMTDESTGFNREKLEGTKAIQPSHSNSSLALAQAHFFFFCKSPRVGL